MGAEFLDETMNERPAPPARVMEPAVEQGDSMPGEPGSRGAQVAEGWNRPRDLAHIEMGAAAAPSGKTRQPTRLRRQLERLELARTLGIPGDIRAVAEDVLELFARATPDELDVLGEVWERIEYGRKLYGPWDASSDPRDLGRERDEEIFDGLVYAGQKAVRG